MTIIDRLGNLARSYFDDSSLGARVRFFFTGNETGDHDTEAAYEELEDFLRHGTNTKTRHDETFRREESRSAPQYPAEVAAAWKRLGVKNGTSLAECKSAYKKLLQKTHPDRHAGDDAALKKATEESALLNAAMDTLETYYKGIN